MEGEARPYSLPLITQKNQGSTVMVPDLRLGVHDITPHEIFPQLFDRKPGDPHPYKRRAVRKKKKDSRAPLTERSSPLHSSTSPHARGPPHLSAREHSAATPLSPRSDSNPKSPSMNMVVRGTTHESSLRDLMHVMRESKEERDINVVKKAQLGHLDRVRTRLEAVAAHRKTVKAQATDRIEAKRQALLERGRRQKEMWELRMKQKEERRLEAGHQHQERMEEVQARRRVKLIERQKWRENLIAKAEDTLLRGEQAREGKALEVRFLRSASHSILLAAGPKPRSITRALLENGQAVSYPIDPDVM